MEKFEEALQISEEILSDLELDRITLSKICFKCLRLTRLLWDTDATKWFTLEIHWYDYNNVIPWVQINEYYPIWVNHGRWILADKVWTDWAKQQETNFWSASISSLETSIQSNMVALTNISTPQSYTPAVSSYQQEGHYSNVPLKTEIVQEKLWDVITKVATEQRAISKSIKTDQEILGRIKATIYGYVLDRNHQLKYGNAVYNIFESSRVFVIDTVSALFPELSPILSSIDDNLQSENQIDWSNAIHNCRRMLTKLADKLCPPQLEKKINWKKEIDLWEWAYINRLVHYIESKSWSQTFQKIVWTDLKYIWNRLDAVYESSNKWTHTTIDTKEEAERYVIHTFLLLNDILKL